MSRLSNWPMVLVVLVVSTSLVYGASEFALRGTKLTAEQAQIRKTWIGTASASLVSMTGLRLARREWRRLIAGLDTSDLPDAGQLQDLEENHHSNPDAVWITDMTRGFLHSGFCHNTREKATNVVGLVSSAASAVLLGAAFFNPISGPLAIAGIATGSIGVGTLLKDLFSFSRFEYWVVIGRRIGEKLGIFLVSRTDSSPGPLP